MRKIKWGIIGCGGIANGKHMPSLAKVPNVRMVAFCDIIPERAEKAKAKYGTPDAKVYTDYKELLKDKAPPTLMTSWNGVVGSRPNPNTLDEISPCSLSIVLDANGTCVYLPSESVP